MLAALTRIAVATLVAGTLVACTSGGNASPSTPMPSTSASAVKPPSAVGAVSSGPTTIAQASACPLVTTAHVYGDLGQRLGRITVLRSGGKIVGCRFYAQAHPDAQCGATCFSGEHLPGPNQPVVEIRTYRYATALAARNAFVLASRAGAQASTVALATSVPGITYRTRFVPGNGATDWACGFSTGTTRVLIRSDIFDSAGQHEVANFAQVVTRAF